MSCIKIDLGPGATAFVCSRGTRTREKPCAYCKTRPSRYLCDAPLRGKRQGQTCDGAICESCATLIAENTHLCPSHRRERDAHEAKLREADAWLDEVAAITPLSQTPPVVGSREVSAPQAAAVPRGDQDDLDKVDRAALAQMFPGWDPNGAHWWGGDLDVGPPVNAIAGEIRAQAVGERRRAELAATDSIIDNAERVGARAPIAEKVEHVRRATQDREHTCHWPNCGRQVKPAMWGCKEHWFTLPKHLRDRIWATYVAGQEQTLSPSREYLDVTNDVDKWILGHIAAIVDVAQPQRRTSWEEAARSARERDRARGAVAIAPTMQRPFQRRAEQHTLDLEPSGDVAQDLAARGVRENDKQGPTDPDDFDDFGSDPGWSGDSD